MIRAALCVLGVMVFLMLYVVMMLVTSAQDMTGNGGPIMAILAVLAVLMSVALTERLVVEPKRDEVEPMPSLNPSLRALFESKRNP